MAARGKADRGTGGFTLIELLVVLSILGTVIGVVGAAVMLGMGTADEVRSQIDGTAWGQVAARWFETDARSAEGVWVDDRYLCALSSPVSPGQLVVTFEWALARPDADAVQRQADWYRRPLAGADAGTFELLRATCSDEGGPVAAEVVATRLRSVDVVCPGPGGTACGRQVSLMAEHADGAPLALTVTRRAGATP